ncbi:uncharacterized protein LOC135473224 [Liolophura sinensis]|uniref:uncharacterized protein LOC135473224 n=1 Tax=Liolophura sinensis TaxID=3198878 RepID=UPI0031595896
MSCLDFQTDHVQVEIVRQILKQVLVSVDQVYGAEPVPMEKIKEQLDKYIDRKVDEKITELLEFCRLAAEAKREFKSRAAQCTHCTVLSITVNPPEEISAQVSAGPSVSVQPADGTPSVQSTDQSARVQSTDESVSVRSTDESPSFQDCYSDMEGIPLDDVSVAVPDDDNKESEVAKTKEKSLMKRLFKKRSRRSDSEDVRTEKKPLLFRKLFKRLPIV